MVPKMSSCQSLEVPQRPKSIQVKISCWKSSFVQSWATRSKLKIVVTIFAWTSSMKTRNFSFPCSFCPQTLLSTSRKKFCFQPQPSTVQLIQTSLFWTWPMKCKNFHLNAETKSKLFQSARTLDWSHWTVQRSWSNLFPKLLDFSMKKFTFATTVNENLRSSSSAMSFQSTFTWVVYESESKSLHEV